ncbi:MAG: helix-turn-helix domain-containing protein [Pyrinomonadaceae bacterium]|nr:helix-turn-helix domain-containing protein [Pyrinomonadaceae bacterium]
MIEVRLEKLLADRGHTFYWLAKETGISHSALWKLKHGQLQAMRFDYLEKICLALDCQPGDVLVMPNEKKRGSLKR